MKVGVISDFIATSEEIASNQFNGHTYVVVSDELTYEDAKLNAINYSNGKGYLASISSQEENDFIADLVNETLGKTNVFLGGEVTNSGINWSDGRTYLLVEDNLYTNFPAAVGLSAEDYRELVITTSNLIGFDKLIMFTVDDHYGQWDAVHNNIASPSVIEIP